MAEPVNFYNLIDLAGVAAQYAPQEFIAAQVFPVVRTQRQQGYVVRTDGDKSFLVPRDTTRFPGNPANTLSYENPTRVSYNAIARSLKAIVPTELQDQSTEATQHAIAQTRNLVENIFLSRERALVTALGATLTGGNTSSPSTKWDNSSGDIIADIKAKMGTVAANIGRTPNALVLPMDVWRKASETTAYKNRIQQATPIGQQNLPIPAALSILLGIPAANIYMPENFYNSAVLGASASMASIWGENTLLFYKSDLPTVGLPTQNLGIHVVYTPPGGTAIDGYRVRSWYDNDRDATMLQVDHYYDQIAVNPTAGHWFTNTLT